MCGFCNLWMCVCVYGFCNVWVCVCVGFGNLCTSVYFVLFIVLFMYIYLFFLFVLV